ncbi:MAG: AbrB/MazE/SpoVT family DNA-binding domain-containing protein [Terracidiphilus sp.]
MPSAMVTFNGRITLPSHVRKQLGLKTGDNVDFVEIEKGRFAIVHGSESEMDFDDLHDEDEAEGAHQHAGFDESFAGVGHTA